MALAAYVVYGVIAVEIWMWTAESVAAVALTLGLIAATAAGIARFALRLMDDGVVPSEATPVVEPVEQDSPASAPARAKAPRPRPIVRPVA